MSSKRISLFPLSGVILFPNMQIPLHIFEPRYRALISDAMARDRQIGLIQPRDSEKPPTLFDKGCLGRIADIEALEDGCFNIILEGVARFSVLKELDVSTEFRQAEATLDAHVEELEVLPSISRAALEMEAKAFSAAQGYSVDWDAVGRLDDVALVNGIAQIAPFDAAAKQALLEINGIGERSELIIQLMQFFGRHDNGESKVTLQ